MTAFDLFTLCRADLIQSEVSWKLSSISDWLMSAWKEVNCLKEVTLLGGVGTCEHFLCFVPFVFLAFIVLTSLFSLFYVTGEFNRFLHSLPTDIRGEKWMRDEQTPQDVCGEASSYTEDEPFWASCCKVKWLWNPLSPVQTDATLLDVTYFVCLYLLLHVVSRCCAKFETSQTLSYAQTDATTVNNAGSCCVRCT